MAGNVLALMSLAVVAATGALWFQRLNEVRAAEVRGTVIGAMAFAALLAVVAFNAGVGWPAGVAAGLALTVSGVFLFLQPFSGQAANEPSVGVGGRMLAFSAPDDAGGTFESASLAGKPYLLKFFRGHW